MKFFDKMKDIINSPSTKEKFEKLKEKSKELSEKTIEKSKELKDKTEDYIEEYKRKKNAIVEEQAESKNDSENIESTENDLIVEKEVIEEAQPEKIVGKSIDESGSVSDTPEDDVLVDNKSASDIVVENFVVKEENSNKDSNEDDFIEEEKESKTFNSPEEEFKSIGLSSPAIKALLKAGINSIEEAQKMDDDDLILLKGFNEASLKKIRKA